MSDIVERLRDYLRDKSMDGREYTRIALLVPDLENAVAEIERLRAALKACVLGSRDWMEQAKRALEQKADAK